MWAGRVVPALVACGLGAGSALAVTEPALAAAAAVPALVAATVARVSVGGGELNVRTGPAASTSRVTGLRDGTQLTVACEVTGQLVIGSVRQTASWDRLPDGRYVTDAYVAWSPSRPAVPRCAPPPAPAPVPTTATVSSTGTPLNVRVGPSTSYDIVGTLAHGTALSVSCQVPGQYVIGTVTRTAHWDRLSNGRYVSDAYVSWKPSRPALTTCAQQPPSLPATQAQFIARSAEPARQGMREFNVPASVTIAQAILETGWGDSELTRVDHNYFGIKCFGTPGPIAIGCRSYATFECEGDRCYPTTDTFRVYRNPTDSFRDHGRFLVVNERYAPAFTHSGDANRFAVEIHRAGYATSPTYAAQLIELMRQYDLYRFDAVSP